MTRLQIEADHRREMRGFARALYCAWHTEAYARTKTLPKLSPLLERMLSAGPAKPEPKRRQTPEEMLAVAELIVAAFGGQDLRETPPEPDVNTDG